jgi:transketolase
LEEEIRLIKYSINLKKQVLAMITQANSGHPGGSLSSTEFLTCLYEKILVHNPKDPEDPNRDRFILSKGHSAPALYALLGLQGYFDLEKMGGLRQYKSKLQGHPKKGLVPGIEISTGSLGQGLSEGIGMALAARLDHHNTHIYVLLGDGECEEGAVWEAAMAASHFNIDNLIAIVDRNAIQLDGSTEKVMSVEPFAAKWEAFGWNVIEIDGTSIREILMALNTAKLLRGKPVMVVAYMIKGQGVSFMQHVKEFHGKPPSKTEYERAMKDLEDYQQKQINRAQECNKNTAHCL